MVAQLVRAPACHADNNIYLPDAYLLDVYASEIVPPLYEIVSNDFCESAAQSQEWRSFWHTYFDVKPYEVGSFVNTIILGNQEATNSHQKKDSTNSIKFWSYLLDNEKFISNPKQLSNFHVLIKHEEGDTTRFDKLSNCYLSDEYNEKGKGIEDFVKEFNPDDNNSFIAPTYLDGDNFIKWADFFKKCRINHETKDLVLNALLPKISSRTKEKSKKDIQLLFTLAKEIEGAGRFQELRNLKVLTIDGGYINLQNTFVTDSYSELNHVNDTLPSIILHHQISEEYLTPDADRKAWLDFWKKLMPVSHILDDKDKVIEQKLKCLVELQDTEGYRAKHLEHFKDVSELYESVKEAEEADKKIEKLSTKISHWKLTEKGVETGTETVALPTSFFLPSAYNPTFDYEGLGVTDLITIQFVSESYLAYPNAKEFLKYLGVCESITPNNLKVLTRPNAAHRFWELWLSTEWDINKSKSKDWFQKYITSALTCMPCGNTCKIPSNVYSLEIADYVVDKSRLPSIDLRNLIIDERSVEDFLEFKKIPSLPDCLTFLKTQPKREQFEKVVTWLKEYNPNISELPNNVSIQDFRQTGKWLNADSRWTNVNNLAYFGSYGSEMRRLFNSNSHRIKFPSGTSSQDEQKICTWLGIPMLLSESSFTITPTGENLDLDFAERLRERLPIIAFDAFSDKNWGEKAQNYLEILDEWKLYTCSKITLSYINVERGIILAPPAFKVKLFKEQKELFYIKSWNNLKTFIDLVNELSGIFGFKQKSDELRDLIYDPKFDVVDMLIEKGLTVPEDWKRPKPTTTNTAFANHGSLKTPNDAGSSTSDTSNSGTQTQTTQEPEEPKVYDPKIEQILRGLDGLNKNSQYSINRQTSGDALIWLEENGWNIENATTEFGILKDIAKDGYVYSIIVRSAKTGLLRLDQYNWNNLGLENYKLLVQTGGRLSDFILYDTQTELLNAPYNNQSIIVKQNTKQPTILTNMVEGLRDDDKATLYFITSEKGASIFNTLTGLKSHSDQESGSAPDSEL